jgi:hypothetical protein
MTKEQINQVSLEAAEKMLAVCVSQAGLLLSTLERKLVLIQAQHLFLTGLELGLNEVAKAQQSKLWKGGEIKHESK